MKNVFDAQYPKEPTFYPYEDCEGNEIAILKMELELATHQIAELTEELRAERCRCSKYKEYIIELKKKVGQDD